MRKYAKFGILIALIVGSITWVATASIQSSKTYYVTITELNQMGHQASSKRVRVGGDVQENSIVRTAGVVKFNLVQETKVLSVVYEGRDPLPDTFKDGAQALAGGRLDDSGVFHAQEVQAKCASKYTPKPGMAPDGLQKKITNEGQSSSYRSSL